VVTTGAGHKELYLKFRNVWAKYEKFCMVGRKHSAVFTQSEIRNGLKGEGIWESSVMMNLPTLLNKTPRGNSAHLRRKVQSVVKIDPSKPYQGAWRDFF